jgi:spermidine synthase/tetratricopeptide (TPR) repeat protein
MDPVTTRPRLGARRAALLLSIFLVSGATSLVYQILWVRVLSLTLGSTVLSISLVVSAFMAGLALGSAFFGRRADRMAAPLRAYAFLELGIGISALVLLGAFHGLGALAAGNGALARLLGSPVASFLLSFVFLLVPTTLMGGTLPILCRTIVGFDTPRGASIGALYAANTIGAILGSVMTGLVLIRAVGIRQATWIAAAGNLLVFAWALWLAKRWPRPAEAPATPARGPTGGGEEGSPAPLGSVSLVYFMNGFAGLALEVLWTRAILLLTTNTIYAFTVILTTFLLGLALGSSVMSTFVTRVRRPAVWLGWLQCLMALVVALTPYLIGRAELSWLTVSPIETGRALMAGEGVVPGWLRASSLLEAYGVAMLFILPATLLMGASFPLVARIIAGSTDALGGAVGRIYALNTVGAVAGSLLAGFVALPALGIQRSITLFAFLTGLSGWWLLIRTRHRAGHVVGVVSVAAAMVVFAVCPNYLRSRLSSLLGVTLTHYEEGIETTVAVYDSDRAARPVLVINNNALDDRGVVHKLLAHLPMLLVERPKRGLVLGFGVGISNQSLSAYDLPVNDCVEISREVMNAAPAFASLNGNIADRNDPSFHLYVEDGRKLLLRTEEPYDLIILDANSGNLRNAGVGKLYTRDFFELCRDRLAPGGMISLYVSPNGTLHEFKLMTRTFLEVFPHASLWVDRVYGQTALLLGGLDPLSIDVDRMLERLRAEKVQADLRPWGLDQPGALLACFLSGERILQEFCKGTPANTDDRPLVEFFPLTIDLFDGDDRMFSDAGFPLVREPIAPYLASGAGDPEAAAVGSFLEAAEKTSSLILDSWIHRWTGNSQMAVTSLRAAAAFHPDAEYLRQQLGYGREAAAAAESRADAGGTAVDLGRAGLIAYRRMEPSKAAAYLTKALALAPDTTRARLDYHVGAARSFRELGDASAARDHLAKAETLGFDATVDRLEVELAETSADPARRAATQRALADALLQRVDVVRALEVLLEQRRQGPLDPRHLVTAARGLETFGDPAGAFLLYREALASGVAMPEVQQGIERARADLGVRLDFRSRANGGAGTAATALESPFLGEPAPASEIAPLAYDVADPWLRLSELSLTGGLAFPAYRRARAARTMEPARAEAYAAIGRSAASLGNEGVARLAFRRAIALGLDRRLVPEAALR